MLLLVDNGSVFTKDISGLLASAGARFDLLPYDKVGPGSLAGHDSFILSGRTGNDRLMNSANAGIIRHCVDESKKLLGICYGAELLALTLGGTIRKMRALHKGSEEVTVTGPTPLASGSLEAYASHIYEIAKLGSELESVASSVSCRHEMVQHRSKRIFGTQFHPEMSKDGGRLIENFLRL